MYDVAISFAGEQRATAHLLATHLAQEVNVFFDDFESHLLWGENLLGELKWRYEDATVCVLILSREYTTKMWPVYERNVIVNAFLKRKDCKRVIPVTLDDFKYELPGLLGVEHFSVRSEGELRALYSHILGTVRLLRPANNGT